MCIGCLLRILLGQFLVGVPLRVIFQIQEVVRTSQIVTVRCLGTGSVEFISVHEIQLWLVIKVLIFMVGEVLVNVAIICICSIFICSIYVKVLEYVMFVVDLNTILVQWIIAFGFVVFQFDVRLLIKCLIVLTGLVIVAVGACDGSMFICVDRLVALERHR